MTLSVLPYQAGVSTRAPLRTPDYEGEAGCAWLLQPRDCPENAASIGSWLVHRPDANPLWQYWVVDVVHLRDVPGVPPANRAYASAEYEFLILTVDPEEDPTPDPDDSGFVHMLPPDAVVQFHGVDDCAAMRLGEMAVRALVDGTLAPEEDMGVWKTKVRDLVVAMKSGRFALN